jgi:glycosyltransferase involved in cell wall biosynthesis
MTPVTLAVPMYNSAPFLGELFERIRALDPMPGEIVFLDDASPDECLALASEFALTMQGTVPVRVLAHQANKGIGAAYNRLICEAMHPWIHLLDADDYPLENDFYARLMKEAKPSVDILIAAMDAAGGVLRAGQTILGWIVPAYPPIWWPLLGSFATRSGFIYRTDVVRRRLFPDPAYPGSDVIHYLEIRSQKNCRFTKKAHVHYRIHSGATSSQKQDFRLYLSKLSEQRWPTRVAYAIDLLLRRLGQKWSRHE